MVLTEILKLLEPLKVPLEAFATDGIEDCVVYTFEPISSNGVLEQNRLKLTVITKSNLSGLNLVEEIKSLLLTVGDSQKTDSILEITLNGGGCLENYKTKTVHNMLFFNVKNRIWRS